jgi:hypothetical protein
MLHPGPNEGTTIHATFFLDIRSSSSLNFFIDYVFVLSDFPAQHTYLVN